MERNSEIVIDYLMGLKYSEIQKKYNVSQGYISNVLCEAGIKTNRKKQPPRPLGVKMGTRNPKARKQFFYDPDYIPNYKTKDNNPIRIDDLDVMERMDKTNGVDDIAEKDPNLRYHIEITEKGEVRYERGD